MSASHIHPLWKEGADNRFNAALVRLWERADAPTPVLADKTFRIDRDTRTWMLNLGTTKNRCRLTMSGIGGDAEENPISDGGTSH